MRSYIHTLFKTNTRHAFIKLESLFTVFIISAKSLKNEVKAVRLFRINVQPAYFCA